MKKIMLIIAALLLIGGALFFFINSKENYDPSRYSASVTPAPLQKGSKVDFTLPDQFGKSHSLEAGTRTVIMTFAKESSHKVRNFLKTQPEDYLLTHEAEYIADIHPMPVVIRNAFAMPDLQKSHYPVLLIYEAKIADLFKDPAHQDEIMIVTLKNGIVEAIDFTDDIETLQKIVQ